MGGRKRCRHGAGCDGHIRAGAGAPEAICLCGGTAPTPAVLEQALRILAGLLSATPGAYLSVV